jgi:hypothetical protein
VCVGGGDLEPIPCIVPRAQRPGGVKKKKKSVIAELFRIRKRTMVCVDDE